MDTKSINSKRYPLWIKALCVLLSVLCAGAVAFVGLYGALIYQYIYKPSDYSWKLTDPVPSVYRSFSIRDQLSEDIDNIYTLTRSPAEQTFLTNFEKQKETLCEKEVQRYLSEKSAIIRNEVYYVATHYDALDTPDYYYDAYVRDFESTLTTTTTTAADAETTKAARQETATAPAAQTAESDVEVSSAEEETFRVDTHAPYNVMYCQKLLNTVKGLGWLQYMSLVRDDAFTEQHFRPRFITDDDFAYLFNDAYTTFDYLSSENAARTKISDTFDDYLSSAKQNHKNYASRADAELHRNSGSFQYMLLAADGTVFSNTDADNQTDAFFRAHKNYIVCRGGNIELNPNGDWTRELTPDALETFRQMPDVTLYLCLSDTIQGHGDDYAYIVSTYTEIFDRFPPAKMLAVGIAATVLLIVFSTVLLLLCGHKAGKDGIMLSFADRIPTDVHLLLSYGLLTGAICAALAVTFSVTELSIGLWFFLLLLIPALAAVLWLIFLEWLTSTVRIKKAGQSYFKRFILWKLFLWLWRQFSRLFRKIKQGVLYILEKPKKIRYVFLLATIVYAAAAVLWTLIAWLGFGNPGLSEFGFAVLTAVYALFQIRYLRTLDTIIDYSCTREKLPVPHTETMPPALRTLAENLSVTSQELDKAVAQAVRDARTKAELITNVSHDLKTPLTSVISYVDLLKGCDIADETAKGYLDILEEKSANLKRLIEDLIEASKVSTGNVELHCTALNLSELAMQAVVEATPELEERGLEIKFAETQDAPIVCADGSKTHRILENLLSNVRKYAAEHSRVYIRVADAGNRGLVEIKNISRDPLDVDPKELMERFVRGDKSRTEDGNGLGLSIAQQLCSMQGGKLEIQIDGDLFKATVYLPKAAQPEAS